MTAPHLLVVEDDDVARQALRMVLQHAGYEVSTAANGREALDHLQVDARPNLILLDLMMPELDGWQFCRELHREPDLASIPILVLSAAYDLPDQAAELGAAGFLEKPVDVEALLTAVRAHVLSPVSAW